MRAYFIPLLHTPGSVKGIRMKPKNLNIQRKHTEVNNGISGSNIWQLGKPRSVVESAKLNFVLLVAFLYKTPGSRFNGETQKRNV